MSMLLCPSMMCADIGNLERELDALEEAGADIMHLDVMDGKYVPNFAIGLQETRYITSHTNKPCDVHLMVTNPTDCIAMFAEAGVRIIYIHPETDAHPIRTLTKIAQMGVAPGIAINPETTVAAISCLLDYVDYLMVMTVSPGFAGQSYLSFVDEKIAELVELKRTKKFSLLVDGACSPAVIRRLSQVGVDGFVLGTSALFGQSQSYSEAFLQLRQLADNVG